MLRFPTPPSFLYHICQLIFYFLQYIISWICFKISCPSMPQFCSSLLWLPLTHMPFRAHLPFLYNYSSLFAQYHLRVLFSTPLALLREMTFESICWYMGVFVFLCLRDRQEERDRERGTRLWGFVSSLPPAVCAPSLIFKQDTRSHKLNERKWRKDMEKWGV